MPDVNHGFRRAGPAPTVMIDAVVRCVEECRAPERLLAESRDPQGKITLTRSLFPYPQVAKYKGTGSTYDAANFAPGRSGP